MSLPLLRALQEGIEALYRVETDLDVCDFLLGQDRGGHHVERRAREQLLIRQDETGVQMGLFLDEETLENLELRDPRRRLDESNLQDFLLAVEGVSHFVYTAHRARVERPVSAVELELQAEIDKYIVVWLVRLSQTQSPTSIRPDELRERLFGGIVFAGDLSDDEQERYALANSAALRYVVSLETRFVQTQAVDGLLHEARRFYRKGFQEKLEHITRLAA